MTQYLNRQLVEAFVVGRTAVALAEDVVLWDQAQSRAFAGRAAVEANLSWDAVGAKMERVYETVIARGTSSMPMAAS